MDGLAGEEQQHLLSGATVRLQSENVGARAGREIKGRHGGGGDGGGSGRGSELLRYFISHRRSRSIGAHCRRFVVDEWLAVMISVAKRECVSTR